MRAAKADANQRAIVEALRRIGASVQHLHTIGSGCPDILVGLAGVNYLLEIKDGELPPSGRKLTADEHRWHDKWDGQVAVVYSVEDALALLRARRRTL